MITQVSFDENVYRLASGASDLVAASCSRAAVVSVAGVNLLNQ